MSQQGDAPRQGDTLRVLLSTDNHLGYAEKDPIRGNDSFRSFREILQLAQRERVDLLLLGGDLFHDNKPSRRTMYETMRLLRNHCMGDGAVNFQVVSDQSINFPNFGVVNFEDPNYNVELPIFSIHGNHDDPAREGGGDATQSLAALDMLSAANLVNYFGKSEKVDQVEVFPVLLTKGNTRESLKGDFFITQPGSSVATSLVEGEAKPKQVAVAEINGQSFRMTNHDLHTVRPFKMGEVILNEIEELEPHDPKVAERIGEYLEGRVLELLHEAELEQEERLRERKDRINASDKKASMELEKALLGRPVRPTPLANVTIEDILSKQLCVPERKLMLLPEAQLGIALEKFTLKNNSSAIQEFVDSILDETQRELNSKSDAKSTQDIMSVVGKKKEQTNALHALQQEEQDEITDGNEEIGTASTDGFQSRATKGNETKSPNGRFGTPRSTKKAPARKKPVRKSVVSDMEDASDESPVEKKPPTPRKAPARSARKKTRKTTRKKTRKTSDSDASAEDDGDEDYKMEDDGDEEEDMTPRPSVKSRGKAPARAITKAKKTPPTRKRLRKSSSFDDDDDDDDFAPSASKRSVVAPTSRSTSRNSQTSQVLDLCSDSDEKPPLRKRVKQTTKKIPQQHKIDSLFKKQLKRDEDDDVEEDQEFTQFANKTISQDIVGPTQSQSESQMSQANTGRRKLPLSMVAASQSQSQGPKRAGNAVPAARKSWGRSRR
ncbi:Double-strand break repair protein [Phytophthora megakarya]|uniref:Double-strand break repair protein n=1 Tax=Phytophthora megakarya TaxID=4795 RepID=A0A225WPL1_9STRA|nr:Double-strand break repair protein [Phytophthora megakarya]